jgi:hypothetical protein
MASTKPVFEATAHTDSGSDAEFNNAPKVPAQFADESFKLFSKIDVTDPTPEEAIRIRNKCLWRILPFLCVGYHLMYVDKQTVCLSHPYIIRADIQKFLVRKLCDPRYHG